MSNPGGSNRHEHSFADVLNSLNTSPRRPAGSRSQAPETPDEQFVIPWLPTSRPATEQDGDAEAGSWIEAWGKPDPQASPPPPAEPVRSSRPAETPAQPPESPPRHAWSSQVPEPSAPQPRMPGPGVPQARTVRRHAAPIPPIPAEQHRAAAPVPEEWGEPEDFASAVRPYTWTRGRTRPVHDLAVETLVSTSPQGRDVAALASVEHRAVAELCMGPRSVAEVAALLVIPLGVARVLLADMADIGLVAVHRTATSSGDAPEFGFMERVLSGLRRL